MLVTYYHGTCRRAVILGNIVIFCENMGKKKSFKGISKTAFFRHHNYDFFQKSLAPPKHSKSHIRRHFMKKCFLIDPCSFQKWRILVKKSSKSVQRFKSYDILVFFQRGCSSWAQIGAFGAFFLFSNLGTQNFACRPIFS